MDGATQNILWFSVQHTIYLTFACPIIFTSHLACSQFNIQFTSLSHVPSSLHLIFYVLSSTHSLPQFRMSHHHYISSSMFAVQHANYLTFTICHKPNSWHIIVIFATFVSMFSTFLMKSVHYNVLLVNKYRSYVYVKATFQTNPLCFK